MQVRQRLRWMVRSSAVAAAVLVLSGCLSVTTPSLPRMYVGHRVSIPMQVSGGAGTWSAVGLPEGLTIDPATGVIAGWPSTPSTGPVAVTVTTADGTKATRTYNAAVETPNRRPFTIDSGWVRAVSDDGRTLLLSDGRGLVLRTQGEADLVVPDSIGADTERLPMSSDGRVVAFDDGAQYAVREVYVWERGDARSTLLTPGPAVGRGPNVSSDGRVVTFDSSSPDVIGPTGGEKQSFVYDRTDGSLEQLTHPPGQAELAMPSATGRFVSFNTTVSMVPEDVDGSLDGYVLDRETDAVRLATAWATTDAGVVGVSPDGGRVAVVTLTGSSGDVEAWRGDLGSGAVTRIGPGYYLYSEDVRFATAPWFEVTQQRWDGDNGSRTDVGPVVVASRNGRFLVRGYSLPFEVWDLGPAA